jgi:hypothetical protein
MQAKTLWVMLTSMKTQGLEKYKVSYSKHQDAFPAPKWPTQTLEQLIEAAFTGRMIMREDHPAFLRKIGARQTLA